MEIAVVADGSRGDVLPYLSIAKELLRRGHTLRFITSPVYASEVERAGLPYFSNGAGDPVQVWRDDAQARPTRGLSRYWRHLRSHAGGFRAGLQTLHRACQTADAVVLTTSSSLLGMALQAQRKPFVICHLSPVESNWSYPRPIGPFWWQRRRWGAWGNWFSHAGIDQLFWLSLRPEINAWRKEELQLPPAGWWRGWRRSHTDGVPILFGISPAILPFPQGWPATHSLTGFWLAEPDLAWEPSSPLQNFLQHDQPVVFLGFGSHIVSAALIRDVVIPAARRCRLRVVMNRVAGLDFVPGQDTDILAVDFVPYRWIFERVALVVHHCGVGTVAEALRAAVPMVLVPFSGEQRFWAERLWDVGVAGIPLNPQALTVETLATAFEQALVANPKVRQKQQELAFHLRQEEGVTRAVTIIEQHFAAS